MKSLYKLDNIYKRKAYRERYQTSEIELFENDELWICLVIEICQGFEYAKDAEVSEYAGVFSWIMLEYVWKCLK